MSKKSSCHELELNRLFQQNKNSTDLPADIKAVAVKTAKSAAKQDPTGINWYNWTTGIVATAATALLTSFIMLQPLFFNHSQTGHIVSIEYHDIDATANHPKHSQLITYNGFKEQLQRRQGALNPEHNLLAMIESSQSELAMRTCDNKRVILSPRLLQKMQQQQRIGIDLPKGASVTIKQDDHGHILEIELAAVGCANA